MRATTRHTIIASIAGLLAATGLAEAAEISWDVPLSGLFHTGGNWSTGTVPAFGDVARLDQPGVARTVVVQTMPTNQALRIERGFWELDLNNSTYTLTNTDDSDVLQMSIQMAFNSGSFATLTLADQEPLGTMAGESLVAAWGPATTAVIYVENGSSLELAQTLRLASAGSASLLVRDGGFVSARSTLMCQGGGTALIHVGADGEFVFDGPTIQSVGRNGVATIEIVDGGLMTCYSTMHVGQNAVGDGHVIVDGAGSWLDLYGTLIIGNQGDGTLEVTDGGSVDTDDLVVANEPGSTGSATLDGMGSSVIVYNDLDVFSPGSMTIANGAVLDVRGTSTLEGLGPLYVNGGGTFRTGRLAGDKPQWFNGSTIELTDSDLNVSPGGPMGDAIDVWERDLIVSGSWDVYASTGAAVIDAWGGRASAGGNVYLGRFGGEAGRLIVEENVSQARIDILGSLFVGGGSGAPGGIGEVDIRIGGSVQVGEDILVWPGGYVGMSGDVQCIAKRLIVDGGLVEQYTGEIVVSDDLTGSGFPGMLVDGVDSASVVVRGGGTLSTGQTRIASIEDGNGLVTVTGAGTQWDCDGLLTLGNLTGSADEGRLVVENGAVVEGYDDVTVFPNGTIHVNGGTLRAPYVEVYDTLSGVGDVEADVFVHDGGRIAPGSSPGLLAITGADARLRTNTGSAIEIELAGLSIVQFDRIEVDGLVELLGGALQVSTIDGFVPSTGQLFEVLRSTDESGSGGILGTFESVEPADRYAPIYTAQSVFLEVLAPMCGADLDGSGHVGFDDLAMLLGTWGPCAGPCAADLDGSGHVGFDDLATLLGSWGTCPS